MFIFHFLEYRGNHTNVSYLTSVFLGVCLDFLQFICLVTSENTKLLEYLNTHEAIITNCFDTNVIVCLKYSSGESFFHVNTRVTSHFITTVTLCNTCHNL